MNNTNDIYILASELISDKFNSFEFDCMTAKNNNDQESSTNDEVIKYLGRRYSKKIDRSVGMAIYTAEKLLEKTSLSDENKKNTGICFGNNYGGWSYVENQMYGLYDKGENTLNPYVATAWFPAAAQGEISIRNKLYGHSKTFSLDQLSSSVALEYSMDLLKNNKLDYVLTGGYESLQSNLVQSFLNSNKLIDDDYVASEASSVLLLSKSKSKNALAKINYHKLGSNINDLLMEVAGSQCGGNIDYCILPPISTKYFKSTIENEIKIFDKVFSNRLPIGVPSYFLGDICGASFSAQINIAVWMLLNNRVPYSYLPECGLEEYNHRASNQLKNILIIGRDYNAEQYSVSVLCAADRTREI